MTVRAAFRARPFGSQRLAKDRRGAALVEFAIAILPISITFFGCFQWGILAYVHLIVKHAAFVAARAEAVIHPGMPDAGHEADTKKGVMLLFKHVSLADAAAVSIDASDPAPTSEKMDVVTVKVDYHCGVPLGDWVACGMSRHHMFKQTASFPNQGSSYQRVWSL